MDEIELIILKKGASLGESALDACFEKIMAKVNNNATLLAATKDLEQALNTWLNEVRALN